MLYMRKSNGHSDKTSDFTNTVWMHFQITRLKNNVVDGK